MLFMLLLCYDPRRPAEPGRPNRQPEHAALEAKLRDEGVYVSGAALWPVALSKVVRREGDTVVRAAGLDAAPNEVIGGYYIVECNEEEALAIAGRLPLDPGTWARVQAIALFHPAAERLAGLQTYVDPRLAGLARDRDASVRPSEA